jgi:hypothetical protein
VERTGHQLPRPVLRLRECLSATAAARRRTADLGGRTPVERSVGRPVAAAAGWPS